LFNGLIAYLSIISFGSKLEIISNFFDVSFSILEIKSFATIVSLPSIFTRLYFILSPKASPWFAGRVQGVVVQIKICFSDFSNLKKT
jgi:hypothetical protein